MYRLVSKVGGLACVRYAREDLLGHVTPLIERPRPTPMLSRVFVIAGSMFARPAVLGSAARLATRSCVRNSAHAFTLKERNPFDCHVYFEGESSRDAAVQLRERMRVAFPWMRFHRVFDRCIGPHPLPMWEADFAEYGNADRWEEVISWLERERGNLTVLVHPHSTDGSLADHTVHATWLGTPLQLRMRGQPSSSAARPGTARMAASPNPETRPAAAVGRRAASLQLATTLIGAASVAMPRGANGYDSLPSAAGPDPAALAAQREARKQKLRERAAKKNSEAAALAEKAAAATTSAEYVEALDAFSAWIVVQGPARSCVGSCQWLTAEDASPLPEGFRTREFVAMVKARKEALPQVAYECEMTRTNKGICLNAGKQAEAAYAAFLTELKGRAPLQYETPYGPVSF